MKLTKNVLLVASLLALTPTTSVLAEQTSPQQPIFTDRSYKGNGNPGINASGELSLNTVYQNGAVANQSNITTSSKQQVVTVPSVSAPPVYANGQDSCFTGASGSVSVLGFGASAGGGIRDESCERLKHSARLQSLGLQDAALLVLMDQPGNKEALKIAAPAVYEKIMSEKLSQLNSTILAMKEARNDTYQLEKEAKELSIDLRSLEIRRLRKKNNED